MAIASVTYLTIINLVKNYLYGCNNAGDNYTNIEACFKSGWVGSTITISTSTQYTSTVTPKLTGNPVSQVTTATISSDLDTYITSLGITDTSAVIPTSNFTSFFNNLVNFCVRHVIYYTSQYSSNKLKCYGDNSSSTTYNGASDIIIYAYQANNIESVLDSRVSITARNITCQYGYTFT